MTHWTTSSVFYHVYPLGLAGAPQHNDFSSAPVSRLDGLLPWLDHITQIGCNALYIGPLFESSTHGYDTADYYHPDRRLGDRQTLARFTMRANQLGLRVILDAVFNHVGRDFWAFKDVLQKRGSSPYVEWFSGLDLNGDNSYHDGLQYDTWAGHDSLVKLNLAHPEVRSHLFGAVEQWIDDYHISGLRLDAADVMDKTFLGDLATFGRSLDPQFWLMGEVVGGDYRQWAAPGRLNSVTNYEVYKGLYSSFNDHNFFEIAWSLNRQFGLEGLYRGLRLYSFADNHDVNRVASILKDPAQILSLYALLFTLPGLPSIYYGSEFGIRGEKNPTSDAPLRPALDLAELQAKPLEPDLLPVLRNLTALRKTASALRDGEYLPLHVAHEQFAFARVTADDIIVTLVNSSAQAARLTVFLPRFASRILVDAFDSQRVYFVSADGGVEIEISSHSFVLLKASPD